MPVAWAETTSTLHLVTRVLDSGQAVNLRAAGEGWYAGSGVRHAQELFEVIASAISYSNIP